MWQRHDLLASLARLAESGSVGQITSFAFRSTRLCRADRLVACLRGCLFGTRAKRGGHTGKNPTDRGKAGSKHHLVTDKNGLPLVAKLSAANCHDTTLFPELIDALPTVAKKRGRPRWKPKKVHADKAYDSQANRDHLKKRGICARIARRGIESSERLGKYRWVVERTFAWLHGFRRLRIRYERLPEIHKAFLVLGCCLICCNRLDT